MMCWRGLVPVNSYVSGYITRAKENCHSGARHCASPESITTAGSMDSGPAPPVGFADERRIYDAQLRIGE